MNMGTRTIQFTVGNLYHCHSQGIDNREVFKDAKDYQKFLEILYLANDEFPLRRGDIGTNKLEEILRFPRGKKLAAIGAFCLLPNQFHLALKEVRDGGITTFMRKIGTAYTMYFNSRHKRSGNLFAGPFKASQVNENHLSLLTSFIHASPAELYDPEWKVGHVADPEFLGGQISAYPYSSLGAYSSDKTVKMPIKAILDTEFPPHTVRIQKMLQEARQYASLN